MENALCSDNRVRGTFQYYGAGRTGRFSGRLLQLHNMPQNHLEDLEAARELVKYGNINAAIFNAPSTPRLCLRSNIFMAKTF